MKKLATIAIAFFLVLSAIPAMAGDQVGDTSTFQAFSNLPAAQRDTLTPMTDTELAAIEGGASCYDNSSCSATVTASTSATITQSNTNSGNASASATQTATQSGSDNDARNSARASISQSNRATVFTSVRIRF